MCTSSAALVRKLFHIAILSHPALKPHIPILSHSPEKFTFMIMTFLFQQGITNDVYA
jgi:hypothetical protein